MRTRHHLVLVCAAVSMACGTIDPQANRCGQSVGEDYLPLLEGAKWTFHVDDAVRDYPLGDKSNRIVEQLGSIVKFANEGSTRPAFRWLKQDGSRYVWLRNLYLDSSLKPESDQYYDPPALRFDASQMSPEAAWTEQTYAKTIVDISKCPGWKEDLGKVNLIQCPVESIESEEVTETWKVVAAGETLSEFRGKLEPERAPEGGVPAGDFPVLCHERACAAETCISGTYCFARGVGKVFELSAEREELKSFCLQ